MKYSIESKYKDIVKEDFVVEVSVWFLYIVAIKSTVFVLDCFFCLSPPPSPDVVNRSVNNTMRQIGCHCQIQLKNWYLN